MCGIFLVINKEIDLDVTIPIFKKLINRGPDYNHYQHYKINNDEIFLGQTTLSITGKYNIDNFSLKNYKLLFNGQIYNYKDLIPESMQYYTDDICDTKVLLDYLVHSLDNEPNGLEAIEKVNNELDGMYAYVLHDLSDDLLYLVRDIQGEKNLYYYKENGILVISSEMSLIVDYLKTVGINIELEKEEFKKYLLSRHHMYRKKTIHQDIYQLEPGETIIYNTTQHQIISNSVKGLDTLIDPELYHKYSNMTFNQHLTEFDNLFQQLAHQMTPQHCDYACVVSGGIDSSLSAQYFMRVNKPPKYLIATNCIGKDKISDDLSVHEEALNKNIITIPVTANDYSNEILICQSVYNGPVPTHSAITMSILTRKVKELGIKVLFTGEGADEIFGGYSTYFKPNELYDYDIKDPKNTEQLSNYFNELETNYSNYSRLCNNEIEYENNVFKEDFKKELIKYWELSKSKYEFIENNKLEKFYQASLLCDSLIQLPNVGLKSADLMGMNHGVESRTIFLRKPILRMILNSPIWLKLDFRTQFTKILLKELYLNYFPYRSLLPKQGFAGFPNESKTLLKQLKEKADTEDEDIKKYLGIINKGQLSRDVEWKLINMDFFVTDRENKRERKLIKAYTI